MRVHTRQLTLAGALAFATTGIFATRSFTEENGPASTELPLGVGATVEGDVRSDSEIVHTATLDAKYSATPVRGVRFAFQKETAGPVTIDLRSHLFDAYLVVEDGAGVLIAEDDDGLLGTHSRVLSSLAPGRYAVVACALHGGIGPFALEVHAGALSSPEGPDRIAAEIEDARDAVKTREATLGERHPDTANSLNQLATLYKSQGRNGEAAPLFLRALEIRESALGESHPDTANSLNKLALLYKSEGRYAEAEPLYLRALKIREATLGEDHPDTATSLNNLSSLYHSQRRYGEAEPLFLRALKSRESALGEDHPDTQNSLNKLALLYKLQGRYAEAEPLYLRALKSRESAHGEDHPDTASCLNKLAMLYDLQGRYGEAEPLYLRALEIYRSALGEQHPVTASTLNNLAGLYGLQGRHDKAEPLYLRALHIQESTLGKDHPATANCLNNLALLYKEQGRYGEAEPLFLRTRSIHESTLGEAHPSNATSLNNLALLYYSQGRYSEAEPLFLHALEIRESTQGVDHLDTAGSCNNLAALYESQGRYGEAEPLYLRALKIRESTLGEGHPTTANCLNHLALLYYSQGRYGEAEPLYLRALEIYKSALGEDHPRAAGTLNNLAGLYESLGRYDEAEPLYLRALQIDKSGLGEDHPSTAGDLSNLAFMYASQGRYREAEPLYLRALEITEAALGEGHTSTANRLNNLASLYESQGRYGEAEPLYLRALEIHKSALGQDHPSTATSLHNLSELYHSQGRHAEAMAHSFRALDGGQSWVLRELLRSTSDRRFSIASTQRDGVNAALSAWLAKLEPEPALDDVYLRICAWKGVVFRHVARLSRALSAASEEDAELRRLRLDLINLDGQLSVLAYAERVADPEAHRMQLASLRARRSNVQREILTRMGIAPEREATDGAELSRLLPERTAVLDFLIHRPWIPRLVEKGRVVRKASWGGQRVLCFVTASGAGAPALLDLGDAARLQALTDAWLNRITRGTRGSQPRAVEEEPDEAVRASLLEPILAALPDDTSRLFVIPDDFLGQVPFGALPVGGGRYLLEAVDVTYATDPVTLRDRLEATPRAYDAAPSILAIGGVDYDERSVLPEGAALGAVAELRGGARAFARGWDPLTATAEEVDGLARRATRVHPDARPARILKGVDATEEAVKAEAAGKTVLHFATHGFFERDGLVSRWRTALKRAHESHEAQGLASLSQSTGPSLGQAPVATDYTLEGEEPGLLAGLILAGANRDPTEYPDRDDGVLTATEVAGLDLTSCRLAVLSACQSSLGTGQSGEGLQSLRRGFQEAGAQSVIASLWKVDDAATQRLMHAFYEELWTNKRGVGDALRRARLKVLQEERDPYYWGAFTLSGEWR